MSKKKWALYGIVAFLVLGQLYRPKHTNPTADPARSYQAQMPVTPEVTRVLDHSCANCHSYNTYWPWYSHVAPASWLVVSDVNEAREEMNLSDWAAAKEADQVDHVHEICKQVTKGDMPPLQYTLLHWDARLTAADKKTLCDWSDAELKRRAAVRQAPAAGRDPAH